MNRMLAFTFGVLVGTVMATAWSQFHNFPTVDSPRNQAGSVAPWETVPAAQPRLPAQAQLTSF
jgi:hypothetical protein